LGGEGRDRFCHAGERIDGYLLPAFTGKVAWDTTKPNGQPRRCLDTSRDRQAFGFEAKTDLREGLRRTIDLYRDQVKQN
jgi:GDP-L-fucose synthase